MACILFMMPDIAVKISTALIISLTSNPFLPRSHEVVLSSHEISLENRYPVKSVNEIFKYNILHTLDLMGEEEFILRPGETFAFHDDVMPEYKDSLVKTTNAHFNAQDGFKFSGLYYGDGVCHLASLIYWVALDAGLNAKAPVNHNFMPIPEIERQFGVSIYSNPYSKGANSQQNLYVTNNREKPVEFKFEYKDEKLKLEVVELN